MFNMNAAKEEFLKEFGEHYGYPNGPMTVDQIRATEFKRLQGHTHSRFFILPFHVLSSYVNGRRKFNIVSVFYLHIFF